MGPNRPRMGPKWAPSRFRCPLKGAQEPGCHFLEKQKVNVPTSPGWIWPKNMGLGKLGVINLQKFLPSGLKIEADILTRSR